LVDRPRTTLVIGYGNTLRGDDGAGPRIAEVVARQAWPGVAAVVVHQLTPELAARIAEAELVIFVDARLAASASEACDVRRIETSARPTSAGHVCDPRSLLSLAEQAFGHRPEAVSVTIPALDLAFGERLSAPTLREMRAALVALVSLLAPRPGWAPGSETAEESRCTSWS
jgi:hydrogenase maturation protease